MFVLEGHDFLERHVARLFAGADGEQAFLSEEQKQAEILTPGDITQESVSPRDPCRFELRWTADLQGRRAILDDQQLPVAAEGIPELHVSDSHR